MKKPLFLTSVLLVCLAGCPTHITSAQLGSLMVRFSTSELASKTIVPPLDMSAAHYTISGNGPGGASFLQSDVTTTAFVRSSLVSGAWTITVDAFNAGDALIGSGSTGVSIQAGETAEVTIPVTPLSGTGSLTINITWPSGVILNPAVSGTLTPAGGSPQQIPFSAGSGFASYSYPSLNAGYYSMTVQLAEGTTVKWGSFEAIRILKDQTTTAAFNLTQLDISAGGASITITPVMQNPIAITLDGQQPELPSGVDMTVTATTSDAVDSYQWYLNGRVLPGATGASVTLGGSLAVGNYRLDLCVRKANIVSSQGTAFTILESPSELITTNLGETGTKLDVYFYRGPRFGLNAPPLYTLWIEDMNGVFIQNLFVSTSVGTNIYQLHYNWAARPEASPYWAHKSCKENPYAGIPGRDYPGVYLALPTADGGPIPSDLDAVTGATRQVDFRLSSSRKNDGVSQFRVLLELQQSYDWNTSFPQNLYPIGGQPPLVYGAIIDTGSSQRIYAMTLMGASSPDGTDGALHDMTGVTTATGIVGKVLVHVTP